MRAADIGRDRDRHTQGHAEMLTRFAAIAVFVMATALPCSALANQAAPGDSLPSIFTSVELPAFNPDGDAHKSAAALIASNSEVSKARKHSQRRYRNVKVVNFRRMVNVGDEDVILKVQSPGKRKSIMMVELKF